jgi:putative tricarboxylic transport membrane protein
MILGFVLGPTIEQNLIRGLMYSNNSFFAFFKSPIAGTVLVFTIAVILYTAFKEFREAFAASKRMNANYDGQ